METPGIEVVLFADRFSKYEPFDLCPVRYAHQISSSLVWGMIQRIGFTLAAILKHPIATTALLKLNYKSGFSIKRNLASLLSSAHLFSSRLDWLHFGFGTMAIGRENLARVLGVKLAVSFRGFDHYVFPLKHPGCYTLLFKLVDKVHVLSQGMRKSISTKGIPNSKISVITPAFDMRKRIATIRRADNRNINLITVARLHWIKGLEYTLESLALLLKSGADFHYTIIGEGEERERLMFAVYQLGLTDRVTFCGRLSHDETIEKLAQADIYIQYSIQEGFCNAVLEAQAMGLLCVVSDAEGLSENVLHGQTGWVVHKRRPALLAQQIEEILSMKNDSLIEIRNNAIKRVGEQFNLMKQKEAFISFYKS